MRLGIQAIVDLLCEPARLDEFVDVMRAGGWQVFNETPVTPQVFREHALTLIHDQWTCNVDLHHWFPGMYADPQTVFEELWIRRSTVSVAAQQVTCTDPTGSAVVAGLHLLRSQDLALTPTDTDDLVTAVREQSLAAEVATLAEAVGASDVLAPFLDRMGAPPLSRGSFGVGSQGLGASDDARAADICGRKSCAALPGVGARQSSGARSPSTRSISGTALNPGFRPERPSGRHSAAQGRSPGTRHDRHTDQEAPMNDSAGWRINPEVAYSDSGDGSSFSSRRERR